MFKNIFFRNVLRTIDWLRERRRELYFILMAGDILFAVGYGAYIYLHYRKNPMFENPSTVFEHFSRPVFISMISIVLILIFGAFVIHLVIMTPFKRITFFKMEMEFDTARDKLIANQFLYSSTMLHNHTENVKYLLNNELKNFQQVLQFLLDSYRNSILTYNNTSKLSIDIVSPDEIEDRTEKSYLTQLLIKLLIRQIQSTVIV